MLILSQIPAEQMTPAQLDWLITLVVTWVKAFPMVSTLLVLIGIDVLTGCLVAIGKKKLNSTTSWRGMTRKIVVMLLVGVGAVLQPFAQGLPLANMVSMFYIVTEAISILENAGALGVPLPQPLLDVLMKMKDAERDRVIQKLPPPPAPFTTTVTVTSEGTPPAVPPSETPTTPNP